MTLETNKLWDGVKPRVSIITPVYNRRRELPYALASISKQSFTSLEHIVIDDGSQDSVDDIMEKYMEESPYPVAFIKKPNGGVHTARNAGIKISRGELIAFLDSDDEFLPDCLKIFVNAWDSIPMSRKAEYRECNAFCIDQNGRRIGKHIPEGINELPYPEAIQIARAASEGEKVAIMKGDIMRDNPWPEPEGVTFVSEGINWLQLGRKYKTWFLDDAVRVYHMETESICRTGSKRSNQQLVNKLYNYLWYTNNGRKFGLSKKQEWNDVLYYSIIKHNLLWRKANPKYDWAVKGIESFHNRLKLCLLWIPAIIPSIVYKRKHS